MKCKEIILRHVYTCRDDESVIHAATLMRDARIGFLVVVDAQGRTVGVITDRDLVLRLIAENRPLTTPIREVMTSGPLVTFDPEEQVAAVAERMAETHKWRAVSLDERGACRGVLSGADVAQREDFERVGRVVQTLTGHRAASDARISDGW